jgi:predicted AlkP superfamily pyrophosphatase or phosphodiesterase
LPKRTECATLVSARDTQTPYSQGMSLSTKHSDSAPGGRRFERIFWVVLDGMGYEHARRAVDTGRFPTLSRIAREGYLGPSAPSSPVCQTPPALLALFSGTEPARNGIWGYRMPDPIRRERSVSGFAAQPRDCTLIWDVLESRGVPYSLMNVAFRNDPVWSLGSSHLAFGYDGYRLWAKPAHYDLRGGREEHSYGGIHFRTLPQDGAIRILKGDASRAVLGPGQATEVRLTRGTRVMAQVLDSTLLVLSPLNPAMVRGRLSGGSVGGAGAIAVSPGDRFLDTNVFRAVRRLNQDRESNSRVPLEAEMAPSVLSMRQKIDLMAAAAQSGESQLCVGYFPLIDEFNHAYVDLLDSEWPEGRASEVFLSCVGLVEELLDRLMRLAGPGTLVVLSSDHGAMPHRSMLHVNERLAEAGLVRRASVGTDRGVYDLRRSAAYYHPSDCGQVIFNEEEARRRHMDLPDVLGRLHSVAEGAGIGMQVPDPQAPYLAFFYPLGDCHFTGAPPRRGRPALDSGKAGGHHLSPLSGSSWMPAVLGLWNSGPEAPDALRTAPTANTSLSPFLLDLMGVV